MRASKKNCATNTALATRRTVANPGAGYHKIHLTVKQKDMVVQTRDGYYSDK